MNTQSNMPDPQAAYDHLFEEVHAEVFFQKIASAGFEPRSPEEAAYMLETAGKLRLVAESPVTKAAGAQDNVYYQMNKQLDTVLAQHGFNRPTRADTEIGIKQAAASLSQDPMIYNSVLALKLEEAEVIRQRLQQR